MYHTNHKMCLSGKRANAGMRWVGEGSQGETWHELGPWTQPMLPSNFGYALNCPCVTNTLSTLAF